jgi:hypothetical protein
MKKIHPSCKPRIHEVACGFVLNMTKTKKILNKLPASLMKNLFQTKRRTGSDDCLVGFLFRFVIL